MIMPFGKYRGSDVRDVPEGYLKWALENVKTLDEALAREMLAVLTRPASGVPVATSRAALDTTVRGWFRAVALRYHPDRRGGSSEAMVALNDAHDRLRRALGL